MFYTKVGFRKIHLLMFNLMINLILGGVTKIGTRSSWIF